MQMPMILADYRLGVTIRLLKERKFTGNKQQEQNFHALYPEYRTKVVAIPAAASIPAQQVLNAMWQLKN